MGTIVEARGGVETVVDGVDGVAVVVETGEMDLEAAMRSRQTDAPFKTPNAVAATMTVTQSLLSRTANRNSPT